MCPRAPAEAQTTSTRFARETKEPQRTEFDLQGQLCWSECFSERGRAGGRCRHHPRQGDRHQGQGRSRSPSPWTGPRVLVKGRRVALAAGRGAIRAELDSHEVILSFSPSASRAKDVKDAYDVLSASGRIDQKGNAVIAQSIDDPTDEERKTVEGLPPELNGRLPTAYASRPSVRGLAADPPPSRTPARNASSTASPSSLSASGSDRGESWTLGGRRGAQLSSRLQPVGRTRTVDPPPYHEVEAVTACTVICEHVCPANRW